LYKNAHGDPLHIEMIKSAISNLDSEYKVYFMWELDIEVANDIIFPPTREERFQPDYHAGAVETAQMATFFPEKIRYDKVKALKPMDSFHPLAYCGDPASYSLSNNFSTSSLRSKRTHPPA